MSGLRASSVERPAAAVSTEVSPSDFRAKLYQSNASLMETVAGPESGGAVRRAGRLFSYHFCGWLPVDRALTIEDGRQPAECHAVDITHPLVTTDAYTGAAAIHLIKPGYLLRLRGAFLMSLLRN